MPNRSKIFLTQVQAALLANMRARYRGSWAGYLWVAAAPLLIFATQAFVFTRILKIDTPQFYLFLVTGLLPWLFLSQALDASAGVLVQTGSWLHSLSSHPTVPLLAQILENLFNIVVLFTLLLAVGVATGSLSLGKIPLLLIPFGPCLVAAIGLGALVANLQVFFRDAKPMARFAMQIGFFLTPVFYPEHFLPSQYHFLLSLNPFHHLLVPFRDILQSSPHLLSHLLVAFAIATALCLMAWWTWRTTRDAVYIRI